MKNLFLAGGIAVLELLEKESLCMLWMLGVVARCRWLDEQLNTLHMAEPVS